MPSSRPANIGIGSSSKETSTEWLTTAGFTTPQIVFRITKRSLLRAFLTSVCALVAVFLHLLNRTPEWERIKKTLEAVDRAHAAAAAAAPIIPPVVLKRPSAAPVPAPPPPAAVAKPSIKLKVGGSRQPSASDTGARFTAPKPREVDLPPPAYVDDGSHDILQEVIAMEEMDKAPLKPSAKRKKSTPSDGDEVNDDDLLALATPAKKEKYSPGPSRAPVVSEVEKPRPSAPKLKLKAKDPSSSRPQTPAKESTSRKRASVNIKQCKDILKSLSKLPEASIFARPVNPLLDGCPTYALSQFIHARKPDNLIGITTR